MLNVGAALAEPWAAGQRTLAVPPGRSGPLPRSPPDACARGAAQLRPPTRMLQLALAGEIKDNRKEG